MDRWSDMALQAVRTACNIQVVGTCGQERPAVTWKKLTENVCHEWKLSADCQRNTLRSGIHG